MRINNNQCLKDLLESVDEKVNLLESRLMNQRFDSEEEKNMFYDKLKRFRHIQLHLFAATNNQKVSNTLIIE